MKANKTFNLTTTNHLESLNNKIKQVVVKNSNLLAFFKDLVTCLKSIHQEQKQKAINLVIKKATYFEEGSVENLFRVCARETFSQESFPVISSFTYCSFP